MGEELGFGQILGLGTEHFKSNFLRFFILYETKRSPFVRLLDPSGGS